MLISKSIRHKSSRAFTLIELLVVIAIIALLVSILLPSLTKAKDLARKVTCQANLRHMATAWNTYADDNNELLATPSVAGRSPWWEGYWPYRFKGYLHDFSADDYDIGREEWKKTILYCPAAMDLTSPEIYYEAITYAINAFLGGTWDADGNLTVRSYSYDKNAYTKMQLSQVVNSSGTMVWSDAGYGGRASLDLYGSMSYLVNASSRHMDEVNMVFVDGHCETEVPADIELTDILLDD